MKEKTPKKTTTRPKNTKPKSTSKKTTRIGVEQYVNTKTGEVQQFNVIEQYDQDFNFDKIWLGHILDSLDLIGNKKIIVLNWLLKHKNKDNIVIGTQRKIAESANVSLPVVSETMQLLVKSNFIKAIQDGVYLINPEVIFKGKHGKRMDILLRYRSIEEIKIEAKKPEKIDQEELMDLLKEDLNSEGSMDLEDLFEDEDEKDPAK